MLKKIILMSFLIFSAYAGSVNYIKIEPLSNKVTASFSSIKDDTTFPIITWGADSAIIKANGDSKETKPNSLVEKIGYRFIIQREDDFVKQLNNYISGKTPFLRGTVGMIALANDIFAQNEALKPVIFHQLSWSDGGDTLVVNSNKIKTLKDLKGKTVVVQYPGPHMDMLASTLKIAELSIDDVNIKAVPNLTETTNSDPSAAMRLDESVDAAFVILPDALSLTNNGNIGTGAEGSVKGAKILFTTKGTNMISDVVAVRNDYFQKYQGKVEALANVFLKAQKEVADDYKSKSSSFKVYANLIIGGSDLVDVMRDLYADMRFTNLQDNKNFLDNISNPKALLPISKDKLYIFNLMGLVKGDNQLLIPSFNWDNISMNVDNTKYILKKDSKKLTQYVSQKQKLDVLDDDTIISFVINFKPNQTDFSEDMYKEEFDKVLEIANTFAGSIITIEGHSDNLKFLMSEQSGQTAHFLKQLRQSARNLSLKRAASVREALINYSKSKNFPLDNSQFTIIGYGIEKPLHNPPKNKMEWLENMRVEFRLIKTDAELIDFEPI